MGRLRLGWSYPGVVDGHQHAYGVARPGAGFGISALAGALSGLLGVGGGFIKVPAMNVVMGVPMKPSVATSNFMIGVTAATSAGVYFTRGDVSPFIAAPVAMGVLTGTVVGTRLLKQLHSERLRLIFAVVLVITAIQMMLQGLGLV